MCGIAGFLSNGKWTQAADLGWLDGALKALEKADPKRPDGVGAALDQVVARFDQMMAFATHVEAAGSADVRAKFERAAAAIEKLETALSSGPDARAEPVERMAEKLRDYAWQIRREFLDNVGRTLSLLPADLTKGGLVANRAQHLVAWGIEQVLENIDRLEVRGRDSAGISIQLKLDGPAGADGRELGDAGGDHPGSCTLHETPDGTATARFVYKVAQLIGKLGDNGHTLRQAIRADQRLWQLARRATGLSIIAHTRWASNGLINLDNCHPLNARLQGDNSGTLAGDADGVFALNGDVDNYRALVDSLVTASGQAISPEVTTDAKIIPVVFRLDAQPAGKGRGAASIADRFLGTLRRLDGSMAIALQHPEDPDRLYLGQKGSGQALFVGEVADGLIVASENYGLAPRTRASIALSQVDRGGVLATLSTAGSDAAVSGRTVEDGAEAALKPDGIEIFARDIFRGRYDHFFEKEVHEAPASVRKTLVGRYVRKGREVSFELGETGPWAGLRRRLVDPTRPPIRRVLVTGQGTAAIAGMGVAHLLRQALAGQHIHVEAAKASELSSGNLGAADLNDTLVIAISQSGTTTDTNRTVDLARKAGAWIHAIVNRRNSSLVKKSDSHIFTSDGRDIEMAVASTKAFYSQVAAGKMTTLCIADALGTLSRTAIHDEMVALEGLPGCIQEVLNDEDAIAELAAKYAPRNRYWAVVGNGANKIAAEEVRIKLSELCYKSIPVDFTEDKKHIDLSTEPLTLVMASDLAPLLAQDTAKEVAIFKAHSGKPLVFAARGETCFDAYAEAIVHLPQAGAGLDFVLATVAGHLWGFHAARAIDRTSLPFRELAAELDGASRHSDASLAGIAMRVEEQLALIAEGNLDAALPPRLVASMAQLVDRLRHSADAKARQAAILSGIALMRKIFEETSRPIDTIRHQAKTVTVGISRPEREVSPLLHGALGELGVTVQALSEQDRSTLTALSALIVGVEGGVHYRLSTGADGETLLQTTAKSGRSAGQASRYDGPAAATGSKRRALRLGRAVLSGGKGGTESLLLLPLFDQTSWTLSGLVLLHTAVAPQASLQQKTALLRELQLYEDLFDAFHENAGDRTDSFAGFLEKAGPRQLLFQSPEELLRRR